MISVQSVPVTIPQQLPFDFPLERYLAYPQAGFPGHMTPPALPPEVLRSDPGTIYWPAGASRFALAQFLVNETQLNQIREGITPDPNGALRLVEIEVGGEGTGQDSRLIYMFLLEAIPIANAFAASGATEPPETTAGLYLLLLVDWRYAYQYTAPPFVVSFGDSWQDVDAAINVDPAILLTAYDNEITDPSSGTPTTPSPEFNLPGYVGTRPVPGHVSPPALLDLYCEASGRRLISRVTNRAAIQTCGNAASAIQSLMSAHRDSVRWGNYNAWPVLGAQAPDDPRATPLSDRFTCVLPRTIGMRFPVRGAWAPTLGYYEPTETIDEAAVLADTGLLPEWAEIRYVDELWVDADAWGQGAYAVHEQYLRDWARTFWGWTAINCFGGVVFSGLPTVDLPETGLDWLLRLTADDLTTTVFRGRPINYLPSKLLIRAGVEPPSYFFWINVGARDGSPASLPANWIRLDEDQGFVLDNTTPGLADLSLADASPTQTGVVNTSAQNFAGLKTFEGLVVCEADINIDRYASYYHSGAKYGEAFVTSTGPVFAHNLLDGASTVLSQFSITRQLGKTIFALYDGAAGGCAYALGGFLGADGTDALGNVFTGGICTTVGAATVPWNSAWAEDVRDVVGTALVAGSGITITVNDPGDTITITCGVTQYTDEMVRDVVGTALVGAPLIKITVNDGADTITLDRSIRGCRAYNNGTGSIGSPGGWVSIALNAENWKSDTGYHSTSSSNSQMVVPSGMAGLYKGVAFLYPNDGVGSPAGTVYQLRLLLNNTTVLAQCITEKAASGSFPVCPIEFQHFLSVGDYVELQVYYTSPSGAYTHFGNDVFCFFEFTLEGVAP